VRYLLKKMKTYLRPEKKCKDLDAANFEITACENSTVREMKLVWKYC